MVVPVFVVHFLALQVSGAATAGFGAASGAKRPNTVDGTSRYRARPAPFGKGCGSPSGGAIRLGHFAIMLARCTEGVVGLLAILAKLWESERTAVIVRRKGLPAAAAHPLAGNTTILTATRSSMGCPQAPAAVSVP